MKKCIILIFCFFAAAAAVETCFFTFKGMDGFGGPVKTDGIGIHSSGYLTLIPGFQTVCKPSEEIVWSVTASGETIYAGVGETGKILYAKEDGTSGIMAELGKFCVKALAADKAGALLAGGPDGVVYKFTDIVNQTRFFETGEQYIWSLVCDSSGTCYAGTGPQGKIFRIKEDGTGGLLYDGEEKHILAMTAADDVLYAGTGGEGIIYKISIPSGKGSVLTELPGGEITDIAVRGNDMYAVSNPGKPSGKAAGKPKKPSPKSASGSSGGKGKAQSGIFKISLDTGKAVQFFKPAAGRVTSMALLDDGRIAAGADTKGTVYLIEKKNEWIVFSVENVGLIRDIYSRGGGFLAGTEKKGFIMRFSERESARGEYVSSVRSIGEVEKWGILETDTQPSDLAVTYLFRTGKVKKTDENWTDWKQIGDNDLSVLSSGDTYFQMQLNVRSSGTEKKARINRIKLSYMPVNRKPEITEFKVAVKGGKNKVKAGRRGNSGGNQSSPKQTGIPLVWKSSDPDGDVLLYTISRRFKGEDRWIPMQEDIKENKTVLNTAFIPEGTYSIKCTVSDEKANIAGRGFTDEKELDEHIVVDRTPPEVTVVSTELTDKSFTVRCRAQDALSLLTGCSFRINHEKEWQGAPAQDLLYDEKEEECRFSINRKDVAEGDVIVVRFDDDAMNYALVRIVVKP